MTGWDKGWRPTEYGQGHRRKAPGYVVAQYKVVPNLYQTALELPTLRSRRRLAFLRIFDRSASPSSLRWRSHGLSIVVDGILVLVNTFVIVSPSKVGLDSCFIIRV